MFTGMLRLFRLIKITLRGDHAPKHLALGIALGLLVGVIPKDNLIAVFLATSIMATRANLLAALIAGFAGAWIGYLGDPFFHRVGALLLTAPQLEPIWSTLYNSPLIPWTRFNNTVVLGSLTFGMVMFYPTYHISFLGFNKYGPPAHNVLVRYRSYRYLAGVKDDPAEEAGKETPAAEGAAT